MPMVSILISALSLTMPWAGCMAAEAAPTRTLWSGELHGLSFEALEASEQVQQLSSGFAREVASALSVDIADVLDLDGHPGQVSLSAVVPSGPAVANVSANASVSAKEAATTPAPVAESPNVTTQVATTTPKTSMPPLQPLRGIAYGALPCTTHGCGARGMPSEDMLQVGYEEQWGSSGRDDLGLMATLGANAVRLYHSLGLEVKQEHGRFLDHAESLGLNVMPGFHTESANQPGKCPKYDCFETWKTATLLGFEHGFRKNEAWHPAIAALVLLNEPDFFGTAPKCQPSGPWCRVKAALSALDGVLAAEREVGVAAGRVRLTVTWSFAMRASIDGKVTGPGTFGFQDMAAGIEDPQIADYVPRSSLEQLQVAFKERWVHGLNTQAPWNFVRDLVSKDYEQYLPVPWFIGEYGANGQEEETIRADLESMEQQASKGGAFLGAAFFQFQTTYWKGGAEMNFGLFGLGATQIGDTGKVCDMASGCHSWPVHCLMTNLTWLTGTMANRARAVATAWHGSVNGSGLCTTRQTPEKNASLVLTPEKNVSVVLRDGNTRPPALRPLRGIAYGALPCTTLGCGNQGRPSEDMLQDAYKMQWGAGGRDDLGVMARLGGNAVRLYHSLGLTVQQDHRGFLDHALAVGLNVLPGYHTESANAPGECPEFDCFDTWKSATLQGFELGFKSGNGWHPAVAMLILLNEPDFFGSAPKCQPSGPWCRVKAALSALDGVLAAEKEAGIAPGHVKLTITWSFAMYTSIDGKVKGPGIFGFQDMVAGIADPQLANYTPRTTRADLDSAFRTRWVHGLNTQAPWNFLKEMVSKDYARFSPTPWFVGEYGANGQEGAIIQADLESMQQFAESEENDFLGSAFFQYQTAQWKGGAEMNFGLFNLGSEVIGTTGDLCNDMGQNCHHWPIHCLSADLSWLPGTMGHRAQAVAAAWGGSANALGTALCSARRRLDETSNATASTKLSCLIRRASISAKQVDAALGTRSFAGRLAGYTSTLLGNNSVAVVGELLLKDSSASTVSDEQPPTTNQTLKLDQWVCASAFAGFLAIVSLVAIIFVRRRKKHGSFVQDANLAAETV